MPEIPASHRDLLNGEFVTLATIGPDGRPQLSEVWFLAEGDTVATSLNSSRQKTKNLRANPAATVFLLDLAVPYRYLEIRGDAEITPDDDYSFADRVGAKYGTDVRTMDKPGERRVLQPVLQAIALAQEPEYADRAAKTSRVLEFPALRALLGRWIARLRIGREHQHGRALPVPDR